MRAGHTSPQRWRHEPMRADSQLPGGTATAARPDRDWQVRAQFAQLSGDAQRGAPRLS